MRAVPARAGRTAPQTGRPSAALREVNRVTRSPGTPLDARTRAEMESRFGSDFSAVRLHEGARARASTDALGARAYTIGSHIVLGDAAGPASRPAPGVLAHELAHVVQGGARPGPREARRIGSTRDPAERGARDAARRVASGRSAAVTGAEASSAGVVRRQLTEEPEPLQRMSGWTEDSISVNITPRTTDRTEDDLREPPWCQVGGLDRPDECRPIQGCRTTGDTTVVFEAIFRVDSPPPGPAYPSRHRSQDIQVGGEFDFEPASGGRLQQVARFSGTGRYRGRAQPVHIERMQFTTREDGLLVFTVQVGIPDHVAIFNASAPVRQIYCV